MTDREHGWQFKAVFVKISPPNTLTGIERYLGSGMVKGIGPVYASRLVKAFGADVFDVIEQPPARLDHPPRSGQVMDYRASDEHSLENAPDEFAVHVPSQLLEDIPGNVPLALLPEYIADLILKRSPQIGKIQYLRIL